MKHLIGHIDCRHPHRHGTKTMRTTTYKNFEEFYPFYLSQHSNRTSRRLHFVGSSLGLVLAATALLTQSWGWLLVAVVQAYAFAWVGHFFFELNRPATFRHPLSSFRGDWKMWWDMLTGRLPF
jgi:hypothetical protein